MKLMLDTNVLIEVCVPGRHKDAKEWFRRLLLAPSGPELLVSVVTEYELRRGLHRTGATKSLEHFEDMVRRWTQIDPDRLEGIETDGG